MYQRVSERSISKSEDRKGERKIGREEEEKPRGKKREEREEEEERGRRGSRSGRKERWTQKQIWGKEKEREWTERSRNSVYWIPRGLTVAVPLGRS